MVLSSLARALVLPGAAIKGAFFQCLIYLVTAPSDLYISRGRVYITGHHLTSTNTKPPVPLEIVL